jgi:hypothetical protein
MKRKNTCYISAINIWNYRKHHRLEDRGKKGEGVSLGLRRKGNERERVTRESVNPRQGANGSTILCTDQENPKPLNPK